MTELMLELPFPPSVNHYWRHVVFGKRVATIISKKGREYSAAVAGDVLYQDAALHITDPVEVDILLHAPNNRRRDLDNHAKAIFDAIVKAGVIADDSQVRVLHMAWSHNHPRGSAKVVIRTVAESLAHSACDVKIRAKQPQAKTKPYKNAS